MRAIGRRARGCAAGVFVSLVLALGACAAEGPDQSRQGDSATEKAPDTGGY